MQRTRQIFALFFIIPIVLAEPALAARRKHRPWFSKAASSDVIASEAKQSVDDRSPRPSSQHVGPRDDVKGKGNTIASQALRYKGTRYKFGGTNKKGMDCSGLVRRVYEDLKLKRLPHASASLYSSGKPVRLSELRPGDLVFFKNTYRRGVSHVGVYAGNNKFVHAAGHRKGVTVTRFSDPYYQLHYAGARRLY